MPLLPNSKDYPGVVLGDFGPGGVPALARLPRLPLSVLLTEIADLDEGVGPIQSLGDLCDDRDITPHELQDALRWAAAFLEQNLDGLRERPSSRPSEGTESDEWVCDPEGNPSGTSLLCYVEASPAKLIELFGEPGESDGYKVSMFYVFTRGNKLVTLYDWKTTTMYDAEAEWRPSEFRELQDDYEFHIGGSNEADAKEFATWLRSKLT